MAAAAEKSKGKIGEVAGGAAAECAAVCCCCPCAVVDLILLAVYRVPTAVCKNAWRRRKRSRIMRTRQGLLAGPTGDECQHGGGFGRGDLTAEMEFDTDGEETDAVDFEKEMWDRFLRTGFWRSPSQKDTS